MKLKLLAACFAATAWMAGGGFGASGPIAPTQPTILFNGRDLTGWKGWSRGGDDAVPRTWSVADGVITSTGVPSGYLQTLARYRDYRLTVEWRWSGPPPSDAKGQPRSRNSGVLVHSQAVHIPEGYGWPQSLECQLAEGNAGDLWVIGGVETDQWRATKAKAVADAAHADAETKKKADTLRRVLKFGASAEKPAGEWNKYEIVCRGDTVTVSVNGVEKNRATHVSVQEGHICLQAEGAPVQFRNLRIEPLLRVSP